MGNSGNKENVLSGAIGGEVNASIREEAKSGANAVRGWGYKQLIDDEYRDKRLKGLRFTCDEMYTSDHICENKHFKFMITDNEVEMVSEPEWQDALEELGRIINVLQLDYRSMDKLRLGHSSCGKWWLITGLECSSTLELHTSSFVPKLVQDARLEVCPTFDFVVKVGNGQQVTSQGKWKEVQSTLCINCNSKFLLVPARRL